MTAGEAASDESPTSLRRVSDESAREKVFVKKSKEGGCEERGRRASVGNTSVDGAAWGLMQPRRTESPSPKNVETNLVTLESWGGP